MKQFKTKLNLRYKHAFSWKRIFPLSFYLCFKTSIYISGSENFLMNVCLRTKNLNFTVQYYKSFQSRVLRFLYIDLNLLLHKCELHLEVLLSQLKIAPIVCQGVSQCGGPQNPTTGTRKNLGDSCNTVVIQSVLYLLLEYTYFKLVAILVTPTIEYGSLHAWS